MINLKLITILDELATDLGSSEPIREMITVMI